MTPMELFIGGIVALVITMMLIVVELFAIDDSDNVAVAWFITGGLGTFVWLVLWLGAIVLWLINI